MISVQAIELSRFGDGVRSQQDLRCQLEHLLAGLRGSYPQIPADRKKVDQILDQVLEVVFQELANTGASAAGLASRLQGLEIKGLGQANRLWPQLFSFSPDTRASAGRIRIGEAARHELSAFLRALWAQHFAGRPGHLEWGIAAVLAWRPRTLAEIHACVDKVAPSFLSFEAFKERYALTFVTDGGAAQEASDPPPPDWTLMWQYEGETAYGGAYPPDVSEFLERFLSDERRREPAAKILDIGTGNHPATLLARKISSQFELFGIDVANPSPPPESERIQVVKMSAEALGFPDQAFTTVMSINGIEYADMNRALPEMRRVMRSGAHGALVLHRPDSLIAARSRRFMSFLAESVLLETLALCWLYLHEGSGLVRRELTGKLRELERTRVDAEFARYFGRVIQAIPEIIRGRERASAQGYELVQRFETDLRWTYERDRFLISHMARIPLDRGDLCDWLNGYGFEVDSVEEVFFDRSRIAPPVGWAVRLRKRES